MFNTVLIFKSLLVLLVGYLLGSINSSIIIGRIMIGDDIRKQGSGNAGATNALRVLGKKGGILTLLGDVLKTVIAVLISMYVFKDNKNIGIYLSAVGVILGHNYPVWFGFKGGKGIAVSITAILFADWRIGLIVIVFSILIMAITRYVSLGSVLGSLLCIILAFVMRRGDICFIIFALFVGLLAIYRHKMNIVRLIKGEESKLGSKK